MNRESERKRLVELINNYPCMSTAEDCFMESISDDLAAYLLDNGIVVPPVKVGEDIYTIQSGKVTKQFVIEVLMHISGKTYFKYVPYDKKGNVQWFYVESSFTEDAIGKTVFTSREDAEKALKGEER